MGKWDVEKHIKKLMHISTAKAMKSQSTLTFQPALSSVSGKVVVRPAFVESCCLHFITVMITFSRCCMLKLSRNHAGTQQHPISCCR